jgi:hypothetical protein
MSFMTGQDRTPKFAGQVLPDRTESGLIFLTSLGYQLSYDISMDTNLVSKNLNWDVFKKILKKKNLKKNLTIFFFLSSTFKSGKSPASGKENVRFPDSPDFENLPDFRTGRDVR